MASNFTLSNSICDLEAVEKSLGLRKAKYVQRNIDVGGTTSLPGGGVPGRNK